MFCVMFFSPGRRICSTCNQEIQSSSKAIMLSGRVYHSQCLECNECGTSLASGAFVQLLRDETNASTDSPLLSCTKCYNDQTRKCARCSIPFEPHDGILFFADQHYHENCFRCTQCNGLIGVLDFVKDDQARAICMNCFNRISSPKFLASKDMLEKVCEVCQKVFEHIDIIVSYKETLFHPKCFRCDQCHCNLEIRAYDNNGLNKNLGVLCDTCHQLDAVKCAKCLELLEEQEHSVKWNGLEYHEKCFICTKCEKSLVPQVFIVKNKKMLCLDCVSRDDGEYATNDNL
ncbi:hypothetical protein ACOME3_004388 [Neoechinorhynchus agilis]